jgi:hypothetical protein
MFRGNPEEKEQHPYQLLDIENQANSFLTPNVEPIRLGGTTR